MIGVDTPLLDAIRGPEDLKRLTEKQVVQLCGEIRSFLVDSVLHTGGHLASNLGTVELTVALHRVLNSPQDKIVFDVGHQCYTHKLLTGRKAGFARLRQRDGISGFPNPRESSHDAFVAGHGNTALSLAIGMAWAKKLKNEPGWVVAIIGDGAFTGGMIYEGMNNIASLNNLMVILNDNGMSISKNVGAMARYLTHLRASPEYFRANQHLSGVLSRVPLIGEPVHRFLSRAKTIVRRTMYDSTMFENMGFQYLGPLDGHKVLELEQTLRNITVRSGPLFLHVVTTKGKGYPPAEQNPGEFHGVSAGSQGYVPDPEVAAPASFSTVFGKALCEAASADKKICAITAAMKYGTGLQFFGHAYRDRFFDVGMAEQHAVTFAAGLASQGMTPVAAIYSTFLQRAYDMIIQDVAMLHLHVIFAVDRAGLVGEDGETHHGVFDVGFLRQIPGLTILCPGCRSELKEMLIWAVRKCTGPVAIRYPRGGDGAFLTAGRETLFRVGRDITIVTYGTMINQVISAADQLALRGIEAEVLRLRTIKPLDMEAVTTSVRKTGRLLVVEEAEGVGSVGHELIEKLSQRGVPVIYSGQNIGDRFVTHGAMAELYRHLNLDAEAIVRRAEEVVHREK